MTDIRSCFFASLYVLMVTLPFKMFLSGVLKCCSYAQGGCDMLEKIYILAKLCSTMNYSAVGCELDVNKSAKPVK